MGIVTLVSFLAEERTGGHGLPKMKDRGESLLQI